MNREKNGSPLPVSFALLVLLSFAQFAPVAGPSPQSGQGGAGSSGCSRVSFVESDLAPGAFWYVSLDGNRNFSKSNGISFCVGQGNHSYSIGSPMTFGNGKPAYTAVPSSGNLTVTGSGPTLVNTTFKFQGSTIDAESGSGIFSGLSPTMKTITVAAGQPIIGRVALTENNAWQAAIPLIGVPSWGNASSSFWLVNAPIPNGTSNQVAAVNLVAPQSAGTYYLIFASYTDSPAGIASETGGSLPPSWKSGMGLASLNRSQILQAQQYGYALSDILNDTSKDTHYIDFMAVDVIEVLVGSGSLVTFSERGLPAGAPWWVTIDGGTQVSSSGKVSFLLAEGTHKFRASSVDGVAASPQSGEIQVVGNPLDVTINYTVVGVTRFAPRITGWLHTDGPLIMNQDDQPVRLEGLNDWGMEVGNGWPVVTNDTCGGSWEPNFQSIINQGYDNVSEWGFNFVRFPLSWANLEPLPPTAEPNGTLIHHWNEAYVAAASDVVGNLTARGIAVIIDLHQVYMSPAFKNFTSPYPYSSQCEGNGMPSWLYPDAPALEQKFGDYGAAGYAECAFLANLPEPGVKVKPLDGFINAWRFIASKFASNDLVVGADIINELYFTPFDSCGRLTGTSADFSLHAFYLKVGDALRAVNPNLLLVFEGGPADPSPTSNLSGPLPVNTVYSFHYYPSSWNSGLFDAQVSFAHNMNVPVWLGEFNFKFVDGGPSDPNWIRDTLQLQKAAEAEGVSLSFWGLAGPDGITWWAPDSQILRTDTTTLGVVEQGLTVGYYWGTVTETGLPEGTPWSVNINGLTVSTSNSTITFPVLNGTYSIEAEAGASGLNACPTTLAVAGRDATAAAQFANFPCLWSLVPYFLVVAGVAVAAVAVAVLLRSRSLTARVRRSLGAGRASSSGEALHMAALSAKVFNVAGTLIY